MKVLKSILFTIVMVFLISPLSYASEFIPPERGLSRLEDDGNLLSYDEEEALREKLDRISQETGVDVIIHTNWSLGGKTSREFADDFFDYNGYGLGENYDGILLLLSMEYRDWAISTHGFAIRAFTTEGQDYIIEKILGYLSDGNYYKAFDKFADYAEDFILQAQNSQPYDIGNMPRAKVTPAVVGAGGLISAVFGGSAGLGRGASLASTHKTMKKQRGARNYQVGAAQFYNNNEKFINRTVSRTLIPRQPARNNSGGGGSGTWTSSSGRSHGGSSGKF